MPAVEAARVARRVLRRLDQRQPRRPLAGPAAHREFDRLAQAARRQAEAEAVLVEHLAAVDGEDDVARRQIDRTRRMRPRDQDADRAVEAEAARQFGGHGLERDADPGPDHAPGGDQALDRHPDEIGGDGEADPHRAAGPRQDGGVDPDQAPVERHQRAARIAGIDRRVGLDEGAAAQPGAALRRHDAAGDGLADAERVADGEDDVPHRDGVGVAEFEGGEAFAAGVDAEHGEVARLVAAHQFGGEFAAIGEGDGDLVAVLDDVVVGDDDAVGGHDDAGAERTLDALARDAGEHIAEEALEERVAEEGAPPPDRG